MMDDMFGTKIRKGDTVVLRAPGLECLMVGEVIGLNAQTVRVDTSQGVGSDREALVMWPYDLVVRRVRG